MKCSIICDNNVYPWGIGEFIEIFATSYLKLESLRKILDLYEKHQTTDYNVFIKEKNINIFERKEYLDQFNAEAMSSIYTLPQKKDNYFLFGKYESPEMFWNIFEKNSKPDVYIKYENEYISILEIPESIFAFTKIEVNSPPTFDLTGATGTIIDLFYAGEREDRKRVEFNNGMINQSLSNLQGIVRTEEIIESANISNGLKEYARHQLKSLMEKQSKINGKLGVNKLQINQLI